jgi:hypothetical protein
LPLLGLLALTILSGCEEPRQIVTYTIPTEVPAQLRPGQERMLAAMLPRGDEVWFFKVSGPESALANLEPVLREFVTGVSFDANGPVLDPLPAGWRRAGEKPLRFASINIDTPTKQLDLSISKLARQPDWDEQVKSNVNRWRGQVGLPAADEKWAAATELAIPTADAPGVWVDLVGTSSPPSMSPPFAAARPLAPGQEMPADHPPIPRSAIDGGATTPTPATATAPSAAAGQAPRTADQAPAADSRIEFATPAGWRPGKMSSMRMAAFDAGPESASAELTVIPAGGDLRGNVKRWLGQIRGGEVTDAEVDQALAEATEVTVSGLPGQRYVLIGDEQSIDATIVPLPGSGENSISLFIKMTGPSQTVADQNEAVATFLDSVKLNM